MDVLHPELTCSFCHSEEFEILRNDSRGFVVLCSDCGYAQGATLAHLMAG